MIANIVQSILLKVARRAIICQRMRLKMHVRDRLRHRPERRASSIDWRDLVEKEAGGLRQPLPCRSIYRWKGRIENDDEWILLLKIRSSDFHLVAESIVLMHPDEVPCIVGEELTEGYPPYFDWLKKSTEREADRSGLH